MEEATFTTDEMITAVAALKWFGRNFPKGYITHEVKEHIPGKCVAVEARAYDLHGTFLASDGRFKIAEDDLDDDYYGWAITQAQARAVKKIMAMAGIVEEAHTAEEFSKVLEKKIHMLNNIYDSKGQNGALEFINQHDGAIRKRLQAKLNARVGAAVMEPVPQPDQRGNNGVAKLPKKKGKLAYE